jgi:hypothetical protein
VVERGKFTTNSVNWMSMEGILDGVLISGLGGGGTEGTCHTMIMGETNVLTFT